MGCPTIYCKKTLQYLSYYLALISNGKQKKDLANEGSEEKLEEYISNKKEQIKEKQFFLRLVVPFNKYYAKQKGSTM